MLICEVSDNDKIQQFIVKSLKKAGYKFIGQGYDAQVWSKDEGQISKIIFPNTDSTDKIIKAQIAFYKICTKSHLPTLPKFFEVDGEPYLEFSVGNVPFAQFNMEKLKHIPQNSIDEYVVWILSDLVKYGKDWSSTLKKLHDPDSYVGENGKKIVDKLKKVGEDKLNYYSILYKTMLKLYDKGKQLGLSWDLHTENVMMRSNGELVITDPWSV